jgi:hypothetical protein
MKKFLLGASTLGLLAIAHAQPAWWASRGLLAGQVDDYSAINVGQLKYIATLAAVQMDLRLAPAGAGAPINQTIASWVQPTTSTRDDYAAVNVGQLKSIAKLYYDRLGLAYPWSAVTSDDDDYALVNLGQLKYVFSFQIASPGDADADGLLDLWETAQFGSITAQSGAGNAETPLSDSLSNRAESLAGTNPNTVADQSATALAALALTVYSP